MTSIPHPLPQQITTLLVQARIVLPTRTRTRLSFVLWAVLLSGTVVQRPIARTLASLLPNDAAASSHERRLRRAPADRRLCWATVFAPLVRWLLRTLTGPVTVILDESGHTDVVRVLTAALWYQGRAIPLAWIVWPARVPHDTGYWADCQRLLGRVARVLPPTVHVTVVADRAFGCPAFLDLVDARVGLGRARPRPNARAACRRAGAADQDDRHAAGPTLVGKGAGVQKAGLAGGYGGGLLAHGVHGAVAAGQFAAPGAAQRAAVSLAQRD